MSIAVEKNDCLIIVDVQNDFCPGGALAVEGGDEIVPLINSIMSKFEFKVASRDVHPQVTSHFDTWPVHCVEGTPGVNFHPKLQIWKINQVFDTGTVDGLDGYSAFDATNDNLENYLTVRNINRVFICGIATDFCVRSTALDALKAGFETYLLKDACRAVNLEEGDEENAIAEIAENGGRIIESSQLD